MSVLLKGGYGTGFRDHVFTFHHDGSGGLSHHCALAPSCPIMNTSFSHQINSVDRHDILLLPGYCQFLLMDWYMIERDCKSAAFLLEGLVESCLKQENGILPVRCTYKPVLEFTPLWYLDPRLGKLLFIGDWCRTLVLFARISDLSLTSVCTQLVPPPPPPPESLTREGCAIAALVLSTHPPQAALLFCARPETQLQLWLGFLVSSVTSLQVLQRGFLICPHRYISPPGLWLFTFWKLQCFPWWT